MADKTGIEWTEATWNPVTGCSKVSAGCKNCYAERDWIRLGSNPSAKSYYGREFTDVACHPERLEQPLHWRRPRLIFVNSMSDLFHEGVPFEFIDEVFATMARAKHHTFQVLTKRPERMVAYFQSAKPASASDGYMDWGWGETAWPLPNVWLGVSVEDRRHGVPRIDMLRSVPASVRFISAEPLLDDLGDVNLEGIAWLIAGGESGPKARPMPVNAVRALRDKCVEEGVAFFFKQWGEWGPTSAVPNGVERVGRKVSGSALDGVDWKQFPIITSSEATC